MGPGGMSETGDGAQPQVFVVDSQASYLHVPVQRRTKWAWDGQKFLLLLVGLTVIGLFVEGFLINNLYQRTRVRLVFALVEREAESPVEIPFPLEVPRFARRHKQTVALSVGSFRDVTHT